MKRTSHQNHSDWHVESEWKNTLYKETRKTLEKKILPAYLPKTRWFGGKSREIGRLQIIDAVPAEENGWSGPLLFLEVEYTEGTPEIYLLPLSFAPGEKAERIVRTAPRGVITRLRIGNTEGVLYDSLYDEAFRRALLRMISKSERFEGKEGALIAYPGKTFKAADDAPPLGSQVLSVEQTNTSLVYGNRFLLKIYRRPEEGIHPDLEIGQFLTERVCFSHIPPFAGAVEFRRPGRAPALIGLLQEFVPNQGDAWRSTADAVERYFERILSKREEAEAAPRISSPLVDTAFQEIPPLLQERIGTATLEMVSLLGRRTAELHRALSSDSEDPNFAAEPYTLLYQRSMYQGMRRRAGQALQLLRKNLEPLPKAIQGKARQILDREKEIMERLKAIYKKKISTSKIRIHGDYHLGQVLWTGSDFYIIDFEGEPARPLSERRIKHSPFRDVAGMIRSFHYRAHTSLITRASIRPEEALILEPWADVWFQYTAGAFLKSYLDTAGGAPFVPKDPDDIACLLHTFLLDKAIYEIAYELDNRPEWILIPLKGIRQLLESRP